MDSTTEQLIKSDAEITKLKESNKKLIKGIKASLNYFENIQFPTPIETEVILLLKHAISTNEVN